MISGWKIDYVSANLLCTQNAADESTSGCAKQ
jgi:hypothetical protein